MCAGLIYMCECIINVHEYACVCMTMLWGYIFMYVCMYLCNVCIIWVFVAQVIQLSTAKCFEVHSSCIPLSQPIYCEDLGFGCESLSMWGSIWIHSPFHWPPNYPTRRNLQQQNHVDITNNLLINHKKNTSSKNIYNVYTCYYITHVSLLSSLFHYFVKWSSYLYH